MKTKMSHDVTCVICAQHTNQVTQNTKKKKKLEICILLIKRIYELQ